MHNHATVASLAVSLTLASLTPVSEARSEPPPQSARLSRMLNGSASPAKSTLRSRRTQRLAERQTALTGLRVPAEAFPTVARAPVEGYTGRRRTPALREAGGMVLPRTVRIPETEWTGVPFPPKGPFPWDNFRRFDPSTMENHGAAVAPAIEMGAIYNPEGGSSLLTARPTAPAFAVPPQTDRKPERQVLLQALPARKPIPESLERPFTPESQTPKQNPSQPLEASKQDTAPKQSEPPKPKEGDESHLREFDHLPFAMPVPGKAGYVTLSGKHSSLPEIDVRGIASGTPVEISDPEVPGATIQFRVP